MLREILTRVLLVEKHDDDSNLDDWKSQWVRFASLSPGLGDLPDPKETDERSDWIDKAVFAFAKQIQTCARFSEFWKEAV